MALRKECIPEGTEYWNLPDGQRAELIDGQLYDMAPPGRIHQKLLMGLGAVLLNHIKEKNKTCEVYPAPFAQPFQAGICPDLRITIEDLLQ